MALQFTKVLANYADFGVNQPALHSALNGASGMSMSFAIRVNSLTGGGLNDDFVYVWVDDSAFMIRCLFNGNRIQCNLKPTTTESSENQLSRSGVNIADGEWHYQAFAFDVANDRGASFTDGTGSIGTNLFTTTTIIPGTPTTNKDALGSKLSTGAPANTGDQLDGDLAHFCLWPYYLSRAELESLSAGYSPLLIRPADASIYLPLENDLLDGRDDFDHNLTITGSVPFTTTPHSYPSSPQVCA